LEKVNFFDFELASLTAKEPQFDPLVKYIKKEIHRLRFRSDLSQDGLRGSIGNVVNQLNIFRGRVGGKDADGRPRVFRIMENPDSFGDFEYEDLADETKLNVKAVERSPFFDELLAIAAKNSTMFEKPIQ
jgi:hypothetical protein